MEQSKNKTLEKQFEATVRFLNGDLLEDKFKFQECDTISCDEELIIRRKFTGKIIGYVDYRERDVYFTVTGNYYKEDGNTICHEKEYVKKYRFTIDNLDSIDEGEHTKYAISEIIDPDDREESPYLFRIYSEESKKLFRIFF
ncbi:hypothetical protein [Metaclostridioides mangenotii]|uniref:hypothetical protein n=1 Tax=Metaclostridioides mangenotii TaxID=1540 RepID=UPI0026EFDF98|nr:hypothetical protein [Clostridioides mangenotii]